MFYKFAFESLSTSVALFATSRFPKEYAVTLLSTLTSVFAVIQALSSIAVAQLLVRSPPNHLLGYLPHRPGLGDSRAGRSKLTHPACWHWAGTRSGPSAAWSPSSS
jgi:hypothetical protein